jgi:mannose-6-phosphate isomerase-like protein (cupin superfamily)
MKGMIVLAIGLLSLTAGAQQPPAPSTPAAAAAAMPEPRTFISAAEINERIGKAEDAAKAGTQFNGGPLLLQGSFRANMEYRNAPATAVNVHENEAELFVVIEGTGTMTLGGTLINPTRNGTNLQAAAAQGGVPYKLVKGDMILVPENTAHSVTQVDGKLVLMSMHLPRPAPLPAIPASR